MQKQAYAKARISKLLLLYRKARKRAAMVPADEDEWMKRAVSIWPQFYPQIKNLEVAEAFMKTLGRQLPR